MGVRTGGVRRGDGVDSAGALLRRAALREIVSFEDCRDGDGVGEA